MKHLSDLTANLSHNFSSIPARRAVYCLVILLAFGVSSHPLADDQTSLQMTLDGKSFKSKLGPTGQPADVNDLLVFEDGHFVSKECERRCGYAKVEYWVRAGDDGIQMRAAAPCTKSDAMIYWQGTVRGDEIEGRYTWVNKRWYWTFEKEFWFKGRLVDADNP
jgi:hypothetical protein